MKFPGLELGGCEEGKALLVKYGFTPMLQTRIDGYELVLIYHNPSKTYHLALQRVGLDFTNIHQQLSRIPNQLAGRPSDFVDTLKDWITEYGVLFLASHNERKSHGYIRILEKLGFQVKEGSFLDHSIFKIHGYKAPVRKQVKKTAPVKKARPETKIQIFQRKLKEKMNK